MGYLLSEQVECNFTFNILKDTLFIPFDQLSYQYIFNEHTEL